MADREKFPSHKVNRKPQPRAAAPRQPKIKQPAPVMQQTPAAMPASSVLFLDIEQAQCHFPLWGDDDVSIFDRRCCGSAVTSGSPYCDTHHSICSYNK